MIKESLKILSSSKYKYKPVGVLIHTNIIQMYIINDNNYSLLHLLAKLILFIQNLI